MTEGPAGRRGRGGDPSSASPGSPTAIRLVVRRRGPARRAPGPLVRGALAGLLVALLLKAALARFPVGRLGSGPPEPPISARLAAFELARAAPAGDGWRLTLPPARCSRGDPQARSWRAGAHSMALSFALARDDRSAARAAMGELLELHRGLRFRDLGSRDLTLGSLRLHWALARHAGPEVLLSTSHARSERLLETASHPRVYRLGRVVEGERLAAWAGHGGVVGTWEEVARGGAEGLDERRRDCWLRLRSLRPGLGRPGRGPHHTGRRRDASHLALELERLTDHCVRSSEGPC